MKRQIKTLIIGSITACSAFCFAPALQAQSPIVLDPINLTQNITLVVNKIEELEKMAQQIQMYGQQIKNWSFSDIFNTITRMGDIGSQLNLNEKQLDEALKSMPEEWQNVDLSELKKFKEERKESLKERTQQLLKTQEVVTDNASKIKGQIEKYVSKSNAADGALSAIQAGNEMLATTISQLQDAQALEIANLQKAIEKTVETQSKAAWDAAYGKVANESQKVLTDE